MKTPTPPASTRRRTPLYPWEPYTPLDDPPPHTHLEGLDSCGMPWVGMTERLIESGSGYTVSQSCLRGVTVEAARENVVVSAGMSRIDQTNKQAVLVPWYVL